MDSSDFLFLILKSVKDIFINVTLETKTFLNFKSLTALHHCILFAWYTYNYCHPDPVHQLNNIERKNNKTKQRMRKKESNFYKYINIGRTWSSSYSNIASGCFFFVSLVLCVLFWFIALYRGSTKENDLRLIETKMNRGSVFFKLRSTKKNLYKF